MLAAGLLLGSARPPAEAAGGDSTALAAGTGVLALVLVLLVRPVLAHTWTAAHEGGHALFAVTLGGQVRGVQLHTDQGGVTVSSGVGGIGRFLVLLAGYLGPSMFGLLGAGLLVAGDPAPVLVMTLVLLAVLLIAIRNVFGAVVVCALGGLVWFTLHAGSVGLQEVVAFTWVWVLLIGGVWDVAGLRGIRRGLRASGGRDTNSDVAQLARMTRLPGALWLLFLLLATTAALVAGAALLLGLGALAA